MKFRWFVLLFLITSNGYAAVVNTKADIAPGVIEDSHITVSTDPTKKINLNKISGITVTAAELNQYDPSARTPGYVPTSDGMGGITWTQLGAGFYLPLTGGTLAGDVLSSSPSNDLGSVANPFGLDYAIGLYLIPASGGGTAIYMDPNSGFSGNYVNIINNSGAGPASWMKLDSVGVLTVDNIKLTGLLSAGSLATDSMGNIIAGAGGGGAGVSSVALTAPSWLAVTGSPITSAGTLAIDSATGLTANRVLATPNGSMGVLGLRQLVDSDFTGTFPGIRINGGTIGVTSGVNITNLTAGNLVGQVSVPNGGLGVNILTNHGVVIGQGAAAVHVTTPGTNNQVLKGVTGADPAFSGIVTADLPNSGVTAGTYTIPTLTIDVTGRVTAASNGTGVSASAIAGDVTGTIGATTVVKVQNKTFPAPVSGDDGKVLSWNNTGNVYAWLTLPSITATAVGGDLSGTVGSATVAKINGKTTPSAVSGDDGKVLTYNNAGNSYILSAAPTGNHAVTVIVAANDTRSAAKAGADFTGTSLDGSTAILAAIAALPATGGHIKLLDGTFIALATIPITKPNVVIEGSGWNTIIKRGYNEAGTNGIFTLGNGSVGYGGIELRNMTIDGNKSVYTVGPNNPNIVIKNFINYCRITNVLSQNSMNQGIYAAGTPSYLTIRDCFSSTNGGLGFDVLGSHCSIENTTSLNDGGSFHLLGDNWKIDNDLADTPVGNPASGLGHGIWIDGVAGFTETNNTSLSTQGNGFRYTGSNFVGVIGNNNSYSTSVSTYAGFDISGATDFTLTGNSSLSSVASGFKIAGSTRVNLSGNRATSNGRYGIEIVSGSGIQLSSNPLSTNTLGSVLDGGTATLWQSQSDGTNIKTTNQVASFTGVKIPSITSADAVGTDSSGNIQASTGTIPIGGIIMWSGSIGSIPAHWHICDGTTGTPDLRDRFVIGAGSTYSVAGTGGSVTHSHTYGGTTSNTTATNQAATDSGITTTGGSHTHGYGGRTWSSSSSDITNRVNGYLGLGPTGINVTVSTAPHTHQITDPFSTSDSGGSHFHNLIMNGHNHLQDAHNHTFSGTSSAAGTLPPYYALAFIQRTS